MLIPSEVRSTVFHDADDTVMLILIRDLRGAQLAEVEMSLRKLVHDLPNLLATAQLLSDRLTGNDDPKVRAGADVLSRSFERALDLCHQTMKAGRAQEAKPDRVRFLLDDVVEEVAATGILPPPLGPRFDIRNGSGYGCRITDRACRISFSLISRQRNRQPAAPVSGS